MRVTIILAAAIIIVGAIGGGIFAYLSAPEPTPAATVEKEPLAEKTRAVETPSEEKGEDEDRAALAAAARAFESGDTAIARIKYQPLAEKNLPEAQYYLWLLLREENFLQALGWLHRAAKQGHLDALNDLGTGYRHGKGLATKPKVAVKWYRKAAEQGHAAAQRNLGEMYAEGLGLAKDEAEAKRWFEKAAAQGDAIARERLGLEPLELVRMREAAESGEMNAQVALARILATGELAKKDESAAAKWYQVAARRGHATAQVRLGQMYEAGLGLPRSDRDALTWYRAAAEQGNAEGHYHLGRFHDEGKVVERDRAQAIDHYRRAAEDGSPAAQYRLGVAYYRGHGLPVDHRHAVQWHRKAAEAGHVPAATTLGIMYLWSGREASKDYDEYIVKWLRKEALQSGAEPQFDIEILLRKIEAPDQDEAVAFRWLRSAAEHGGSIAQYMVGRQHLKKETAWSDLKQAEKWLLAASRQGFALAQFELAAMYDSDNDRLTGIPKDDGKAAQWYKPAAEQGEAASLLSIGLMHEMGRGVPRDVDAAERYYSQVIALGDAPDALPFEMSTANLSAVNLSGIFLAGNQIDRAIQVLEDAAGRGSDVAAFSLAYIYEHGIGGPKDPVARYRWLLISADPDNERTTVTGTSDTFWEMAQRQSAEVEITLTARQIAKAKQSAKAWISEHRR